MDIEFLGNTVFDRFEHSGISVGHINNIKQQRGARMGQAIASNKA
jgi:hypothetical protein